MGGDKIKKIVLFVTAFVVLICVILFFIIRPFEKKKARLSSLDENECLMFLQDMGVTIPDELRNRNNLGSIVKQIISELEKNPDLQKTASYSVAEEFVEDIRRAVKQYYGLN